MTNTAPLDHDSTPRRQRRLIVGEWAVVFVACLVLYAATAGRGIQWQDSGQFVLRIVTHELHNPLGLALVHPVHHWIGRLAITPGIGEPSFVIALVSGLFGAVTVANVFGIVRMLTRSRSAASFAAGSLAVANTFWHMATIAEVYTLGTALLSAEFWLFVAYARTRRTDYLWGVALFNGLGVATHLLASLTTPIWVYVVIAAVWKKRLGWAGACGAAAFWVIGTLPYSVLVLMELV